MNKHLKRALQEGALTFAVGTLITTPVVFWYAGGAFSEEEILPCGEMCVQEQTQQRADEIHRKMLLDAIVEADCDTIPSDDVTTVPTRIIVRWNIHVVGHGQYEVLPFTHEVYEKAVAGEFWTEAKCRN